MKNNNNKANLNNAPISSKLRLRLKLTRMVEDSSHSVCVDESLLSENCTSLHYLYHVIGGPLYFPAQ